MVNYDDIEKKGYHFTLKSIFPNDETIPKAVIPKDKCLHFSPEEMLALRRFYKTNGREAPFEDFEDVEPDFYDENYGALLDFLYSSTSKLMRMIEAVYYPDPVVNRNLWLTVMEQELRYNLDDYEIIPPKELIDDVLDDNFTDWVGIMNKKDLDDALMDVDDEMGDHYKDLFHHDDKDGADKDKGKKK